MHEVEKSWGAIQAYIRTVFQRRGIDEVLSREMSVLPGLDELAALLGIVEHHDAGTYDLIVVDVAPTGETLRFSPAGSVEAVALTERFRSNSGCHPDRELEARHDGSGDVGSEDQGA